MKKYLSVVLILAMLFGSAMVCNAGNPDDYIDITGHWASIALESAVTNNILTGYNHKISPNSTLTRAEMATIVVKAFGAEERADISQYTDVPSGKWYADFMSRAVKMGIIGGDDGKLRPEDPVTREEAFSMLAKAFELSSRDLSPLGQFSDKDQVDESLRPEIAAMISAGYVSGGGGILTPKATLLRGQIAQVIYLMVKNYIKHPGTYEAVDPGNVIIRVPDVTLRNLTVKGDLIIGDGVGSGDVTLDNVNVEGRTVVRGGGINSIHIINGTNVNGTVIIDNDNNRVRIVTDELTVVEDIEVDSSVLLEGVFKDVRLTGSNSVTSQYALEIKGTLQSPSVESPSSIGVSGTVGQVDIGSLAEGSIINTLDRSKIDSVTAKSQTIIQGNGTVSAVAADANNVQVDTVGTSVTAGEGTTGVTARGANVPGGTTVTTTSALVERPISLEIKNDIPFSDDCYRLQTTKYKHISIPLYTTPADATITYTINQDEGTVYSMGIVPSEGTDTSSSGYGYLLEIDTGGLVGGWGAWIEITASKPGYTSVTKPLFVTIPASLDGPAVPDPNGPKITLYGIEDQTQPSGTNKAITVYSDPRNVSINVTSSDPSVASVEVGLGYFEIHFNSEGFATFTVEASRDGYASSSTTLTVSTLAEAPEGWQ